MPPMTGDNTNASISKPTTSRNTKPTKPTATKPTATKPNTTKPSAYTPAKHHQPVKHLVDVRRIDPSQARKWQRWVEKGEAVRLARGIYIPAGLWREIGQQPNAAEIQAQAFIVAEYLRYSHRIPAVVAGKSAAFLHGLPLEKFEPPETVELASPKRSLMGRTGRSERHLATPGQGQRAVLTPTEFGEIWTSGLLDTCHDLGLRHSLDDAVIATEAALHTKKITWNAGARGARGKTGCAPQAPL